MLEPEMGAEMPAGIAELLSRVLAKKPCTYHFAEH